MQPARRTDVYREYRSAACSLVCMLMGREGREAEGSMVATVHIPLMAIVARRPKSMGVDVPRLLDLVVSLTLILGIGLLTLFGAITWGSSDDEDPPTNTAVTAFHSDDPATDTAAVRAAVSNQPEASVWHEPLPAFFSQPLEPPSLLYQASSAHSIESDGVSGAHADCRLWNVLRPVDRSLESFWIGGWVRECEGVMGPVVNLGAEESIEEVYLRLENAVAQINRLQQQLDSTRRD